MYADDHQFYAISNCIEDVYNILIQNARLASEWYYANFLKGNLANYQILWHLVKAEIKLKALL